MFGLFKKKQLIDDSEDRQVDKYIITLRLITDEYIEFTTKWLRINNFARGIDGYKEGLIEKESITINEITYNMKNVLEVHHEHIDTAYIRKDVKGYLDGYYGGWKSEWAWKRTATDDELED